MVLMKNFDNSKRFVNYTQFWLAKLLWNCDRKPYIYYNVCFLEHAIQTIAAAAAAAVTTTNYRCRYCLESLHAYVDHFSHYNFNSFILLFSDLLSAQNYILLYLLRKHLPFFKKVSIFLIEVSSSSALFVVLSLCVLQKCMCVCNK